MNADWVGGKMDKVEILFSIICLIVGTGKTQVPDVDSYFNPSQKSPPKFLTVGQKIQVKVGESVLLPCQVKNLGESTVIWKQGDSVIFAGDVLVRQDLRVELIRGKGMKIVGADTIYSGNYTCEIEWSTKEPFGITHYLEVLVPPKVQADAEGRRVVVKQGGDAKLQCTAKGIPRPNVTWVYESSPQLDYYPGLRSFPGTPVGSGTEVLLRGVGREQKGRYTCIARNGVAPATEDYIDLVVLYPPIVEAVEKTVKSGPGDKTELQCQINAQPRANVMWYFAGKELKPDSTHKMVENGLINTLILRDIKESDLGKYTCHAINKLGEAEDVISLTGIPFALAITSSSTGRHRTTFNLTWTVRSFAPLLETNISYRRASPHSSYYSQWLHFTVDVPDPLIPLDQVPSGGQHGQLSSWKRIQTSDIREGSYFFKNLSPNTDYEVRIRARNKFGWSDDAASLMFKTSSEDPSPQKVASGPDGSESWFSSSCSSTSPVSILPLMMIISSRIS